MKILKLKIIYYSSITLLAIFLLLPAVKASLLFSRREWLYIFAIALLLSYLLTPLVRMVALRVGVLDYPDERKIHTKPVPLLGGVAVCIAFLVAVLRNLHFSDPLIGIILGGTIMLIMGVVDDVRGLSAGVRLTVQILATFVIIKYGVMLTFMPNVLWGRVAEIVLTIIWVVGITNALNFIDGMDGLATGLGIICFLSFFIIALQTNQSYLGLLTIALIGSCLGFLRYNFKPAKVFLGDAGSNFMGFTLAGLAIMGEWAEGNVVKLSIPILVLGVPIFDIIYTTAARIKKGEVSNFKEWIKYTGRDHFHHRLLSLGLTERQTVLFIYAVSLCLGMSGVVLMGAPPMDALLLLGQGIIIFAIVAILMLLGKRKGDSYY